MTREERELLLKDLCSRLPYYVKLWSPIADGNWAILTPVVISNIMNADLSQQQVKPYLRPMSSMTVTERQEYSLVLCDELSINKYDWLNAHHFDYRGLIDKGLALKAVDGIYHNVDTNSINAKKLKYINKECGTYYTDLSKVKWIFISENPNLSFDFMREFKWDLRWNVILSNRSLPESFIEEMHDCFEEVWSYVTTYQCLSEDFIEKYKEKLNWIYVSKYQRLSEDFMRKHKDLLNWKFICEAQKLSEDFIREFKNYVYWDNISKYQKLSENFIIEFKHEVNWKYISKYQKLSLEFVDKYYDSLYFYLIDDSWINKDVEFLKQKVIDTGLYECYDDYFIAYKGIRSDRYSSFNFQYQYMTGETYESFCDCSDNENSFGLSVWTKEKATKYCDELVVKVKIKYEDVGRVVNDGGKVRCRKITILD